MRILHTSDWHLGRTLHGENLHAHQEEFHDWLLDQVVEREVDVVVIAGDVYDRAVPPVDSVRLLGATLARLAEVTTVVLTPGNHDSADRLGFGSALMKAGVHILADTPGLDHPVVVPGEHGEVLFFGLPYLEPDLARYALVGEGEAPLARSHEAVTRAAMDRVRARIAAHEQVTAADGSGASAPAFAPDEADGADAARSPAATRPRAVVLAHTFVAGGTPSESERDLSVGGVDSVPAQVLSGVDYVALGHLHGCQDLSVSVGAPAWYSGSPLAFSFSEKDHRKSVLLIDLGAPGKDAGAPAQGEGTPARVSVQRLATPVPRRLTELRGTLEEILARADEHGEDWLKAIITDTGRPPHLIDRLRARYPHLLHTDYQPAGRTTTAITPTVRRDSDPLEVMDDFLTFVTDAPPTPVEHDVFETAYRAVRTRRQEAS